MLTVYDREIDIQLLRVMLKPSLIMILRLLYCLQIFHLTDTLGLGERVNKNGGWFMISVGSVVVAVNQQELIRGDGYG